MARRNWSELQGRVVRSRFTLGQSAVYTSPGGAAVDITVIIGRQPIVNENGVPETLKTCAFNTLEINPVRGALIVINGDRFYVTDPIVGEIDPDFMQRRYIVDAPATFDTRIISTGDIRITSTGDTRVAQNG